MSLFLFLPFSSFCKESPEDYLQKVHDGRLKPSFLKKTVNFFKMKKIISNEADSKITGAFVKDLDFDGKKDAVLEVTTLKEHDAPYVTFVFLLSKEKYRYLPSDESYLQGQIIAAGQFNSYYSKHADLFIVNGVKWETDLGSEFRLFHMYPSTKVAFLGPVQNASLQMPHEWQCTDQTSTEGKLEMFVKDIDNDGEIEVFEYKQSKKCRGVRTMPRGVILNWVADPKAAWSYVARLFDTVEHMTAIKIVNTKKEVLKHLKKFKDGKPIQNPWLLNRK